MAIRIVVVCGCLDKDLALVTAVRDSSMTQGILTRDLGGQASTAEMTAAIISNL